MTRFNRLRLALALALLLAPLPAMAQAPPPASLHGTIRDSEGKPVERATVVLQNDGSHESFHSQTDAQGSYTFAKVPDGVYTLRATKVGYADGLIPSAYLKPGESKAIDLQMGAKTETQSLSGPSSAPQFSDQPQFTVAGITDATNLGGHGSDTVVRARDSLAKQTVSLGETSRSANVDATREKSLREVVTRQATDFSANHQLGQFLLAGGRATEAIPFLQRAFASNPTNFENAFDLALANFKSGNYAAAREQASSLLRTHDQADLHHLLGDIDEKMEDSLEAVRHYQRAAELDATEPNLFDWGAELLLHHAPDPAMEVFSKGVRLFPASTRMLVGLGAANFAHGAYDDAIRYVCRASDASPADLAPYQFLGKMAQTGNLPSVELTERLHRFVGLQPQNADANYYYALALWKLRTASREKTNSSQVEALLNTALQIDPAYAAAALQLGIVHSDQGAYAEAVADYRRALAVDPQMEEAHYRLAQAYRQMGQSDKAKEELLLYGQVAKESAQKQERERHQIKQFVYTLRDPSSQDASPH